MDDGYKSNDAFYIATESYGLEDHQIIVQTLKNKFLLNCSYHRTTNGLRIYIFKNSIKQLYSLIEPYLLEQFKYKFSSLNYSLGV